MTTTTKQALDQAVSLAAGLSARTKSLLAIAQSRKLSPEDFFALVGQAPETLEHDAHNAHQDFERVKQAYEDHCKQIGQPAYVTYNED